MTGLVQDYMFKKKLRNCEPIDVSRLSWTLERNTWIIGRLNLTATHFFFLGGVTATAPSRDLTDNKKNEEGGLKQRRKQKEAAQGDPEPKKGNQEKEKYPSRVQS